MAPNASKPAIHPNLIGNKVETAKLKKRLDEIQTEMIGLGLLLGYDTCVLRFPQGTVTAEFEEACTSLPLCHMMAENLTKEKIVGMKRKASGDVEIFPGTGNTRIPFREHVLKTVSATLISMCALPEESKATSDLKVDHIEDRLIQLHSRGQVRLCEGTLNYLKSDRSCHQAAERDSDGRVFVALYSGKRRMPTAAMWDATPTVNL